MLSKKKTDAPLKQQAWASNRPSLRKGLIEDALIDSSFNEFQFPYSKTYPVSREQSPSLYGFVDELANKVGVKVRGIRLVENPNLYGAMDATISIRRSKTESGFGLKLAVGPKNILYLSHGILSAIIAKSVSEGEFAAVIGHELGHAFHHDSLWRRAVTYASLGLSAAAVFYISSTASLGVAATLKLSALFLLAVMIGSKLLTRRNEYRADAFSVKVSQPSNLVNYFRKSDSVNLRLPIRYSLPLIGLSSITHVLFYSHPPDNKRIARLYALPNEFDATQTP